MAGVGDYRRAMDALDAFFKASADQLRARVEEDPQEL
jgi:hypothetical protein